MFCSCGCGHGVFYERTQYLIGLIPFFVQCLGRMAAQAQGTLWIPLYRGLEEMGIPLTLFLGGRKTQVSSLIRKVCCRIEYNANDIIFFVLNRLIQLPITRGILPRAGTPSRREACPRLFHGSSHSLQEERCHTVS